MSADASDHPALDRIVKMANQIAASFEQEEGGAAATAGHIRKFWDPRMRAQLRDALQRGGAGLSPTARAAAAALDG